MSKILREMIREMIEDSGQMTISVGGFPINVEVANDHGAHAQGLMHRDHLDPDCGMLFCYENPRELSFWMRNTKIPLSIAFIDEDHRVHEIFDLDPFDENHVMSSQPCRWALEVNKSWFHDRNIRVGSRVSGLS